MNLIKYRGPEDRDYTWFWVDSKSEQILSPIFYNEQDAKDWLDRWENWKPIKDIV